MYTLTKIYSGLKKDLTEGYETSAKRQASYVVESKNAFLRLETELKSLISRNFVVSFFKISVNDLCRTPDTFGDKFVTLRMRKSHAARKNSARSDL